MISFKYFGAEWCGPCHQMKPQIDELQKTYHVDRFSVDQHPTESMEYEVKSIPTLFMLENDVIKHKFIGYTSLNEILKYVN